MVAESITFQKEDTDSRASDPKRKSTSKPPEPSYHDMRERDEDGNLIFTDEEEWPSLLHREAEDQ